MSPVNEKQPVAAVMNSTRCPVEHEKQAAHVNDDVDPARLDHCTSCQYTRLRRIVVPSLFLLFTTAVLLFLEFTDYGVAATGGGLLRRASNGNNSPFVQNKLYLIVAIVGLVLVLLSAIALSFWCCKSSFENPCCCPCYLCACCGGLACLECISCGLCAEAIV